VSTDSDEIIDTVNNLGLSKTCILKRNPELATDKTTSDNVLVDFCNNLEFDKVVFLQATSPMTTSNDLTKALEKLANEDGDSLISVVKNHQFIWNDVGDKKRYTAINYVPQNRPMRQDWEGYFIENGCFYISKRKRVLESNCRISGKVIGYEMKKETLFEIDDKYDLEIISKLMKG